MASLTLLGTGTSDGIPMIGCDCAVCSSPDPRNTRLRSSALIRSQEATILIDCGPDFRTQALDHKIQSLDAIVLTHHHADHISGIAELRPLSRQKPIPIYASNYTCTIVRSAYAYIFSNKATGGGLPRITLQEINGILQIADLTIHPLPILHGSDQIFGFRIGNLAYITDASYIPDSTFCLLNGIRYLVINALREKPHPTHFSISQACDAACATSASAVWLTHLCHLVDHASVSSSLKGPVSLATDGQVIEFDEYVSV